MCGKFFRPINSRLNILPTIQPKQFSVTRPLVRVSHRVTVSVLIKLLAGYNRQILATFGLLVDYAPSVRVLVFDGSKNFVRDIIKFFPTFKDIKIACLVQKLQRF